MFRLVQVFENGFYRLWIFSAKDKLPLLTSVVYSRFNSKQHLNNAMGNEAYEVLTKQDREGTYNVIWRYVRATIVVVDKQ